MSSAFNLSTLVAMQDQRVEQTSVHFWRCQLTGANPRFVWRPEASAAAGADKPATSKEVDGEKAAAADVGESTESDSEADEDDAISTRHLLQVSGCVLGPKATGIHLVTVRTSTSYQKRQVADKQQAADAAASAAAEPDPCPIVCMDPAAQRTLALSHEFVLEKQQQQTHAHPAGKSETEGACVFELAEGSGPVWLTGTHRIHRVVPVSGAVEESEDEGEGDEDEVDDVEEEVAVEEEEAESNDEEEDEEIEDEADDDQEMIEEVKPLPAGKKMKNKKLEKSGAANSARSAGKKSQSTAAAVNGQQARKRARPDS